MLNVQCIRRSPGVVGFIPWMAWRTDSEGRNMATKPRNSPADEAGIHAAAEQRTNGHIGKEAHLDSAKKQALGFFYGFVK